MKYLFYCLVLSSLLSSCFKDKPFSEFSKVAGSWEINKFTLQNYDSIGEPTSNLTVNGTIGYFLLTYNEGESAENTFSYSIENNPEILSNSSILYSISLCDRWDVSVDAKHMNFGYFDPVSNGTVQITSFSITKIKSNKMNWMRVTRHNSGALQSMEVFEMIRGN